MDNSLVLDLSSCNHLISVSKASNATTQYIAKFEAGMRLGKLYTDLWNAGQFLFNAGVTPVVGVGGNILGGGRGFLGRKYGYALDQVVSMDVVLATGVTVTANATSYADLFWALRGGNSGSFGVVTHFTVNVFQEPLHSMFFIRYAMAVEVLEVFQSFYSGSLPANLSVSLRLQSTNTYILGHYLGPMKELEAIVKASGALSLPSYQWHQMSSCSGLTARTFACCGDFTCTKPDLLLSGFSKIEKAPKDYEKTKSDHQTTPMPKSVLNNMVALFNNAPRSDVYLEWNLLGGSGPYSTVSPTDTPYPNRAGSWNQMEYAVPGEENDYYPGGPNWVWLHKLEALMAPYCSGYKYQNYPDLELVNFGDAYFGTENFKRLISIKNQYDPTNYFRNEQSIPLTYLYKAEPSSAPAAEPTVAPSSGIQQVCLYAGWLLRTECGVCSWRLLQRRSVLQPVQLRPELRPEGLELCTVLPSL